MKTKFEWEYIHQRLEENAVEAVERAKVIGGWIVRSYIGARRRGASVAMVFIPDHYHEWEIE